MKIKVFRAHLDDVENLSYGKGAKKQRGTGSRLVCHRLNKEERRLYDLAKRDGFLTVKGTGYRKERKGSPVHNTFRQRCDALEQICIVHEKRSDQDRVVIDFSTLRVPDDSEFLSLIIENVLKGKYPELYDSLQQSNNGDNDNIEGDVNAMAASSNTAVIHDSIHDTPINWDAVKTKPIWGVNERLLIVACERNVAKSLAMDVLKESYANFGNIQIDFEAEIKLQKSMRQVNNNEVNEAIIVQNSIMNDDGCQSDDESIDWNDI